MKKMSLTVLAVFSFALSGIAFAAGSGHHWGYQGQEGPEYWGGLSPEYALCGTGKNQSPVDIAGMVEGELPPIEIAYVHGGVEVVNNGHTIQVNYAPGSTVTVEGHAFELKQFHFHAPSENTIEGKSFAMEGHFVHGDQAGNLTVVAVMYEPGEMNGELEKAWSQMPMEPEKRAIGDAVNAAALLPADHDYYRFNGSLTTPPCTEGVNWFVMKKTANVSQEQIGKFIEAMKHDNNRPVQPLNARIVIQ